MKIRSLLIGSVAAAGLATGAHAADLGVLTSLDVCDALGLSGLTISSDTNCLQITGGITYEFNWGDYRRSANFDFAPANPWADADDGTNDFPVKGNADGNPLAPTGQYTDYDTKWEAWLRVVGTADSDFGPAKAVIGIHEVDRYRQRDGGWTATDSASVADATGFYGVGINTDSTNGVELSEAYVSVGDSTVLMAGLRKDGKDGSIGNFDDDTPFNYLGLFGSSITSNGLLFKDGAPIFGGASIQIVSDLGNGVSVGAGLENIDNTDGSANIAGTDVLTRNVMNGNYAGTLLGVVNYAGDSLTAHLTGGAIGVLDGNVDSWFAHAGVTGTFENFKLRAAGAYLRDDTGLGTTSTDATYWQALVSGQATFDMFTLALSGEYKSSDYAGDEVNGWGIGGSIGAKVTDTIALNLGGRWFHTDATDGPVAADYAGSAYSGAEWDSWQIEAQLVASITETLKATAAVGVYGGDVVEASLDPTSVAPSGGTPALSSDDTAYYGSLGLDWAPGGDFTASIKGLATSEGAYKATFKAAKSFQ